MRILLASWGSAGDRIPFVALGIALQARGHTVTLVGNGEWRSAVEGAGLRFVPFFELEEGRHPVLDDPAIVAPQGFGNFGVGSFRRLIENAIVPNLEATYAILEREAAGHDLLIAHHFVFPAGMVHEKTGIPWATVCLAPGVTPSAEGLPGPCPLPPFPGPLGRMMHRMIWAVGRAQVASIVDRPLNALRAKLRLRSKRDHVFSDWSQRLVLHLYSRHFAPPSREWDRRHVVAGFCMGPTGTLAPEVETFLDNGSPPWLFTLGTTMVLQPRGFFHEAAEAARHAGRRAILLVGRGENGPRVEARGVDILAVDAASHGALMPRCAAVAHQCGIGTLAAALHAGIPSVACPFTFDQPNNAVRAADRGVAVVLPARRRTAAGFERAFGLAEKKKAQARALAALLAQENGPERACEAVEEVFGSNQRMS